MTLDGNNGVNRDDDVRGVTASRQRIRDDVDVT